MPAERWPGKSAPNAYNSANTFCATRFSVEKMMLKSPTDTIIYRSKLNPKIHRNFEIFDPVDFLAVPSQYIPDKMKGCAWKGTGHSRSARHLKAHPSALKSFPPGSPPPPRKLPSGKCQDLNRQAWQVERLRCPFARNRCG